jgi:hypothetical protein
MQSSAGYNTAERTYIKIKKKEATFKNHFTILDPYTHQGLSNHSFLIWWDGTFKLRKKIPGFDMNAGFPV